MCVHGSLIVPLLLCASVALGLALSVSSSGVVKAEQQPNKAAIVFERQTTITTREEFSNASEEPQRSRPKRRTRDPDEKNNIESSISLWEWLKGRDKPEDNCMMMAIGGVASGGALTGAFVGAGIGSIFTGPGAIVGGIIGGLVGVFGGLSVGARAGAVACENV
uniref:Glycine zipper domain-containing protein n=1 Tax=Anopheles minimus TaxID=112268 RepID=A0A182WFA8_9DIPT